MACLRNCFGNADRHTDSETRERFGPKKYTFRELANATGHFSNSNSLGEGGFGQVYRGILDGKEVAVKKLKYLPNEQPSEGLLQEIKIVSSVIHKNLVKLLGYCIEGDDILLVLEYFPQKSLNFHLHGNKILEWKPRMKIAKGSAEALAYLHGGCKPKIIHRDVTSSNILLDDDLEAKVTDFGLALFFPETGNLTHISRSNKGTDVYADPDPQNYPSRKVSERSDVYSYGVVLLELITGRKTKFEGVDIVTWAKPRIEHALHSGDYSKLVDSKLQKNYVEEELKTMVSCAAACLYKPSKSRPLMKQIVRALESCKDIEDIWDEKNDNQFLTNDPRPNGTYNVNNFQHMLPKPLVISEAYNDIEFTQQDGLYNASNGTERFKAYFRKGYRLRNFSYQVLTEATGGFSEDNRLDEGPLGQVYMGTLNGEKVAIKKFNNPRKQEEEYKHMKAIGSDFHHRNLVNLIGYCEERANRLLVYEFVPHCRSLRCSLKDESSPLDWRTRYRIFTDALTIKCCLFNEDKYWWGGDQGWMDDYFLDDDFRPKLAEYGREKFFSDFAATRKSTRCTAPEYTSNRTFTQKTDVYSYGVMLVEMITGKEPDDDIVQWVVPRLKRAQSKGNYDFVDKRLKEYDKIEMDRMIACALACLQDNPQDRPEMNQIIEVLKGNIDPQDLCKREVQLTSGH